MHFDDKGFSFSYFFFPFAMPTPKSSKGHVGYKNAVMCFCRCFLLFLIHGFCVQGKYFGRMKKRTHASGPLTQRTEIERDSGPLACNFLRFEMFCVTWKCMRVGLGRKTLFRDGWEV